MRNFYNFFRKNCLKSGHRNLFRLNLRIHRLPADDVNIAENGEIHYSQRGCDQVAQSRVEATRCGENVVENHSTCQRGQGLDGRDQGHAFADFILVHQARQKRSDGDNHAELKGSEAGGDVPESSSTRESDTMIRGGLRRFLGNHLQHPADPPDSESKIVAHG